MHNSQPCNLGGKWENVNEAMSPDAAAYQELVTGKEPGLAYVLNNVKFAGVTNSGVLLDAKANYSQFIGKKGIFKSFFTGASSLVAQAKRQIKAAKGASIEWHFKEEKALNAVREFFLEKSPGVLDHITLIHTPGN